MAAYQITKGGHSARLEPGPDGPVLTLFTEQRETVAFPLAGLIRFSTARPWALLEAGCTDARIAQPGDSLTATLPKAFPGVEARIGFRFDDVGSLVLDAAWRSTGGEVADAMAGLCFAVPHADAKLTLPHCIYNDNPSADPARTVPKVGRVPGLGYVCEEHRLPIPGANLQWAAAGRFPHLSVFAEPSAVDGRFDSVWSLGLLKEELGFAAVSLSGGVVYDGQKDVVYAAQGKGSGYPHSYNTLPPGGGWNKTLYLHWGDGHRDGWGFRSLARDGWAIYRPEPRPAMERSALISLKQNCLDSRWRRDADSCGYACFGAANDFGNLSGRPEYYLYAWTGESLKLAWCDVFRGLREDREEYVERGMAAADFFVKNSIRGDFGMPFAYYLWEEQRWGGAWFDNDAEVSARMVGCSAADLTDLMALLRENGRKVPVAWEQYLRRVCAFLMEPQRLIPSGIYPLKWSSATGLPSDERITSAGVPCVIALAKAGACLDEPGWIDCAAAILERYYHLTAETMERPFAFATLDASCEDKEAGMYFFIAAMELYKARGEARTLEWAGMAADWILTFVYFWEPPLRPGSPCREQGFRVTGWPGVSPQNHHLDVFFPLQELAQYAKAAGEPMYARCAELVLCAWSHGVCKKPGNYGFTVPGEQGEQYFHTNYSQAPDALNRPQDWRGGMAHWNPSWIIAQVLTACLYFEADDEH